MKQRLALYGKWWLCCLIIFQVGRILFIMSNWGVVGAGSFGDVLGSLLYGLKLDIAITGYIMLLPTAVILLTLFWKVDKVGLWILYFLSGAMTVCVGIILVDINLYSYWFMKFDAAHLQYLDSPGFIFASLSWGDYLLTIIRFLVLAGLCVVMFLYLKKSSFALPKAGISGLLVFLFIGGMVPMAARGGFSLMPLRLGIPINAGSVYFSKTVAVNHAAVNPVWFLMYSFGRTEYDEEQLEMMPEEKEMGLVSPFLGKPSSHTVSVLNSEKPNIVFIVLESFTGKVVSELGGRSGLTPNLSRYINVGLFFNKMYATGDRSERGMAGIFSGYPSQTKTAILRDDKKRGSLPNLIRDFVDQDYAARFYYGGEPDFGGIQSYFYEGGVEQIVSKLDFPSSYYNSKWGAHDEIVFDRLLKDIKTEERPFFYTLFTLSSHEPFDVPRANTFEEDDRDHLFMNCIMYTDSCLGVFLDRFKETEQWDNTLIVLLADHGVGYLGDSEPCNPKRFHIPLLFLGGALKENGVYENYMSQTDLPATLLAQMNWGHEEYHFSRDVFSDDYEPMAFSAFGNGVLFQSDSCRVSWDLDSDTYFVREGVDAHKSYEKAYLQHLLKDYMSR